MSTTTITMEPSPVICAGVIVADHISSPIDRVPEAGELVAAEKLVVELGGCASNVAMNLRRMGVRPSICGRVGNDLFGRMISDILRQSGVLVSSLKLDPQEITSQTLILNVKGQDRRFVHCFGANRRLSVEDIDRAIVSLPRVFYLGGFLILPGLDVAVLAERLKWLRARGSKIVLDVATPGPGDYLASLAPVLPHVDVFLPNTDEARLILGESDPVAQAQAFHELGAARVVITLGKDGAVAVSKDLRVKVGAYPVEFVDGTGGGDAFDAGYIAGLIEKLGEKECLALASALGASCVRAIGTTAGVFTRAEAEEFMRANPLTFDPL
jgi:sugar/nucleoside kinase (ribokinase family)